MRKKGYSYFVTDEALKAWGRLSAAQKLDWLEEANRFIWKVAPPSTKALHAAFRSARI